MFEYLIVVISENSIISQDIKHNLLLPNNFNTKLLIINTTQELNKFFDNHQKINLLILDMPIKIPQKILKKTQFIINLTSDSVNVNFTHQLILAKPLRLFYLLKIIQGKLNTYLNNIFEYISPDLLYDYIGAKVIHNNKDIKLTEKENRLIYLLLSEKTHTISKLELLKQIWGFSQDVNTTTLETHIYRLKHKLPKNIIESVENSYKLIISDLQK